MAGSSATTPVTTSTTAGFPEPRACQRASEIRWELHSDANTSQRPRDLRGIDVSELPRLSSIVRELAALRALRISSDLAERVQSRVVGLQRRGETTTDSAFLFLALGYPSPFYLEDGSVQTVSLQQGSSSGRQSSAASRRDAEEWQGS